MSVKLNNKIWIIASSLLFIQLIFFYILKYRNQELLISEFSLSNIGNIFNLLIVLLLIVGLFFITHKKNSVLSVFLVFTFLALIYVTLIISFIGTKADLPGKSTYIFDQPANKLISASLFVLYFLVQFVFLSIIWVSLIRKFKVSIIRSILNSCVILIVLLIFSYIFITTKGYNSGEWILTKENGNLAFVLGAAVWSDDQPSPTLSSRVDRALELLKDSYVDKIFFTGSNAPGELAEATVAYNYAISKQVDKKKLLMETSSGSTNQQILFLKENLVNDDEINHIIIISDSYHLPRVIEICRFYNVDVKVAASRHQLNFKDKLFNNLRESVALLAFLCFAL